MYALTKVLRIIMALIVCVSAMWTLLTSRPLIVSVSAESRHSLLVPSSSAQVVFLRDPDLQSKIVILLFVIVQVYLHNGKNPGGLNFPPIYS